MTEIRSWAALLAPMSITEFFEEYYEAKYLHIAERPPQFYESVLSANDIDQMMRSSSLPACLIDVVKDGVQVARGKWTSKRYSEIADNQALLSLFCSGHTLIMNGADRTISKLNDFRSSLLEEYGMELGCNIYATPAGTQGFDCHYDNHDVFVLQVRGTKKWRLLGSPVPLPSAGFSPESDRMKPEAGPRAEIELRPGDLLYLPRGEYHEGVAGGEASIHLTLGLHPTYLFDMIRNVASEEVASRRAMPTRHANQSWIRTFQNDLDRTLDSISKVNLEELRKADLQRSIRGIWPAASGRFLDALKVDALSQDSRLARRSIPIVVHRDSKSIEVTFPGATLSYPIFMESALEKPLGNQPFRVKDIQGLISEQGKLDLCASMVRAGLLKIVNVDVETGSA